jgi:hypothetical protein
MSAQTMYEAFLPALERQREQVLQDTWGHLAPLKNKSYAGTIVFAVGCFGNDPLNPIALYCEFKGLEISPWFFDCMSEFLSKENTEEGCVYKFVGKFRNYKFIGKTSILQNYSKGE